MTEPQTPSEPETAAGQVTAAISDFRTRLGVDAYARQVEPSRKP